MSAVTRSSGSATARAPATARRNDPIPVSDAPAEIAVLPACSWASVRVRLACAGRAINGSAAAARDRDGGMPSSSRKDSVTRFTCERAPGPSPDWASARTSSSWQFSSHGWSATRRRA